MDNPFISPPAKRSIYTASEMFDSNNSYSPSAPTAYAGASSKRFKQPPPPLTVPAGHVAFRLLCHASRIGGVIGKSGTIIKQLQQDTAAKIRVEESFPGSEDRVVVIIASSAICKKITLRGVGGDEERSEEFDVSAAQEAVVRVFERILDVAAETDGVSVAPRGVVSCRLLAEARQVGSVIGKGGKVIEKIREDTGSKIRVLGSEKIAPGASPSDEMVEIEGDILAVKRALVAVSRCLQDCPQGQRPKMTGSRPIDAVPHEALRDPHMYFPPECNPALSHIPTSSLGYASGGRPFPIEVDRLPLQDSRTQQQEVVFKLLCSNDRVGGVIGKGGSIVKALQNETGASIGVGGSVADCDERLITVTAMEIPDSQKSPAQKAVILVFNRSIEAGIEKGLDSGSGRGSPVSARLVVPSNQVGCLLGKGGVIISEMRKSTGAGIRIIGGDQVPKCASEGDEVVQISGELVNVQGALYNVTCRLRDNIVPNKLLNGAGTRSNSSVVTEINPYGRGRDPQSFEMHSSSGVSQSLNRHTTLTESMDHLGLSNNFNHPPSPRPWVTPTATGVNPRSMTDIGGGLSSVKGGLELGSASRSVIVTNTTVEIVVPENVIGSVYGEHGSNLTRLREISGAKVIVHEPRHGTTDRIVVISGSPDEAQAAQSLLQAFIITGSS